MDLNNREISTLIWLSLFLIFFLWKKETRKSLLNILKLIFVSKATLIILFLLVYVAGMIAVLYSAGLWDFSQLKNTIVWFVTVGFVSLFEITKKEKENFLLKTLKDILKATVIIEFLVGLYTFSLWAELLLVPAATILVLMTVVSEKKAEYKQVHKFLSSFLSVLGLCLIGYALFMIVRNFQQFSSVNTVNDFLISPVLSLLYVPFLYVLSLLFSYESVFAGFNRAFTSPSLRRFAKWQALIHFNFNKSNLRRWQKTIFRENYSSKKEIIASIKKIKELNKIERNPPLIPIDLGWSPYKANEYLKSKGLVTGFYSNIFEEEWYASSPYMELDKASLLSNNIAYYISGNETVATELKLVLNVNSPSLQNEAIEKFLDCTNTLFMEALNVPIDESIYKAIKNRQNTSFMIGNKRVALKREKFLNSTLNGYSIDITLTVIQ